MVPRTKMSGQPRVLPNKGTATVLDPSEVGTTSTEGVQYVTYEQVRDMIDQTEKHQEDRFDAIEARIDKKLSKLDNMPTNYTFTITIVSALVAGLVLVIGVLAYGSDRFNGGAQYAGSTYEQASEAKKISESNAKQIQAILDILNRKVVGAPEKP